MGKILKNKSGKTDFLTLIGIGLIVWLLVGQSGSTGQSASGGTADGAQATPAANTVQIVGDLKRSFDVKGIRVTNPIDYFQLPPWETTQTTPTVLK